MHAECTNEKENIDIEMVDRMKCRKEFIMKLLNIFIYNKVQDTKKKEDIDIDQFLNFFNFDQDNNLSYKQFREFLETN